MPSTPGHMAHYPLTNGHASPSDLNGTTTGDLSASSESEQSLHEDSAAPGASSDEDAHGEQDDTDEHMASDTESSSDEDADGEPDGDYDSETPPPAEVDGRHSPSSSSDESVRPQKRKASVEDDEHITQNPELYGLRRSVRDILAIHMHRLTSPQGRARPTRRIVRSAWPFYDPYPNVSQMDSSDEDDSSSDQPTRKRQRTTSRKSMLPTSGICISTDTALQLQTNLPLQRTSLPSQTLAQMAT